MGFQIGGLATGLDTNSLIAQLLQAERKPITRYQNEKSYLNNRLSAFKSLDGKLENLLDKIRDLDTSAEVRANKATATSNEFFTTSVSGSSLPGTYQIEVSNLSRLQKDVSGGYQSKSDPQFGTGEITFSVGGNDTVITYEGDSLAGIMQKINEAPQAQRDLSQTFASRTTAGFGSGNITLSVGGADTVISYDGASLESLRDEINLAGAGVSASIIGNDSDGYQLVLKGDEPSTAFSIAVDETVAGAYAPPAFSNTHAAGSPLGVSASIINDGVNGYRVVLSGADSATTFTVQVTETVSGTYAPLVFGNTQSAQQASILVDGIAIQSKTNRFSEAIPGVTLDILQPNDPGAKTTLNVDIDPDGVKKKIDDFVSAYNEVVMFVKEQAGASWGRDPGLQSTKRRLQDLLVTAVGGSGSFLTLTDIGIGTQKDGTLKVDTTKLNSALTDDLDSIDKLFAGEEGMEGIATKFKSLLDGWTDSHEGLLATRQESTDRSIRRIDKGIERVEARLDQREKTLRAQFDALEKMVSVMNAQSSYLAQQMDMLSRLGSKK